MRTTLLIHFHQVTLLDWAVFDSQARLLRGATETTLSTLILQPDQQVIVLLPTTEILLTQVEIPTTQRRRLRQAVPFALEEQFAEDIEQLHFALGMRDAAQRLSVAVMAQRDLARYLNALAELSLSPTVVLPDVLALPLVADSWSILLYGQRLLVRTGKQAGFAIEVENVPGILPLMPPPSQIMVWGKLSASVHSALVALNVPMIEAIPDENFLITGIYHAPFLNLLQGNYQPVNRRAQWWRPWRLTAALLLLWGGGAIIHFAIYHNQLQQQAQTLNQQIEQIYRQTFPHAQKIVNPRVQMEQQLNELTGKVSRGQRDNFLTLLNQLVPVLTKITNLNLKEINYQAGKLELNMELPDMPTVELLRRYVKDAGFNATLATTGEDTKIVKAKLRIES
jgi:general secretion pathway protein L